MNTQQSIGFTSSLHRLLLGLSTTVALGLAPVCGQQSPSAPTPEVPDNEPAWYYFDWMAKAPHAPVFRVLDTESSLGPYARQPKTITLKGLLEEPVTTSFDFLRLRAPAGIHLAARCLSPHRQAG